MIALALLIAAAVSLGTFAWFSYMTAHAEDGYQDQDGYHAGPTPHL